MKTDALIELLARNAGAAPPDPVSRRLLPALLGGALASAALALLLFGPIPTAMLETPAPWVKLAYTAALAAAACTLAARLARPAARWRAPLLAVLGVVVLMAACGAWVLLAAPEPERPASLWGQSWRSCPWNVLALAVPALAASLWALRGLAPTRPAAAGAAAGLLAGALGAFGYAFACTEVSTAFVAVWYSAGVALAGGLGALLGARLLRW